MNGKLLGLCALYVLGFFCVFEGCQSMSTTCPDGWVAFHGSCYLFAHDRPSNFVTAQNFCLQHGGHLIQLDSVRENEFIKSYLDGLQHEYYWIGITDELIEGVWQLYGTGSDAPVIDWAPGQPDPDGDCAVYDKGSGYHWHDIICQSACDPLCEKTGETGQTEIVG